MADIAVEHRSAAGGIDWSAAIVAGVVGGIVLAMLIYLFVFYLMTPVWPWFANGRNWVSIFAHVMFGAVVAWWYKARAKPTQKHALA